MSSSRTAGTAVPLSLLLLSGLMRGMVSYPQSPLWAHSIGDSHLEETVSCLFLLGYSGPLPRLDLLDVCLRLVTLT